MCITNPGLEPRFRRVPNLATPFLMTIEYENSEYTYAKRNYLQFRKKANLLPPGRYYFDRFFDIATHGFCAYAAFAYGGTPIIAFVGVLMSVWTFMLLCKLRPYGAWLHGIFIPSTLNSDQKRIRLEFADDGLREHQGDIVSFVPWKDVSETMIEDDLLVIILSSRQEALIPRMSFGISNLNLEEIRDEIERRRVR